jgi:hypothetical protein
MKARTTVNDRSTKSTDILFSMLSYQEADLPDMFAGNDETADTIEVDEALAYLATLDEG